MSVVLAAALAALAAGVAAGGAEPSQRVHRLLGAPAPGPAPSPDASPAQTPRRAVVAAAVLALAVLAATGSGVGAALGALAGGATVRALADRARRRADEEVRELVVAVVRLLVAELRSGRLPDDALLAALAGTGEETQPGLGAAARGLRRQLLAALAAGADLPPTLVRLSETFPGAEGLRRLAVCWEVTARHGASLAATTDRVLDGLLADEECRRETRTQLASAHATARLLAGLPLLGVLLAALLGVDVAHVLLHTAPGAVCAGTACALVVVGLRWTGRIVTGVGGEVPSTPAAPRGGRPG